MLIEGEILRQTEGVIATKGYTVIVVFCTFIVKIVADINF